MDVATCRAIADRLSAVVLETLNTLIRRCSSDSLLATLFKVLLASWLCTHVPTTLDLCCMYAVRSSAKDAASSRVLMQRGDAAHKASGRKDGCVAYKEANSDGHSCNQQYFEVVVPAASCRAFVVVVILAVVAAVY